MKVFFYTLGCKVNQYETEGMRELFINRNDEITSEIKEADVVIINSCTVTAESDRKTRQTIRRHRRLAPHAVIVVTGCMVQASPEKCETLPEADLWVGNNHLAQIPEMVDQFLKENQRSCFVTDHPYGEAYATPNITDFSERTRAYLKIEDECDRYCSYCIIPFARGHVRSRSLEEIRLETEQLSQKGYTEIVLVGINLSAYGFGKEFDLCDAVAVVGSVDGIHRVRLGSLEPDHITDEMLMRLKEQSKFCPQFHLSLQSGCDATLKRMNRHYDSAFYEDLVCRIRRIFPDSSITTDIMVGFPGETAEEFSQSLAFADKIGFAKAHVFIYSKRKGTVAAQLPNQVPASVAEQRSHEMIQHCSESEQQFYEKQIGQTVSVLFESEHHGIYEGYTPNYTRVQVSSADNLTGRLCQVMLESTENNVCRGKIIE